MEGESRFIHGEIKQRTGLDISVIKVAVLIGCYIHTPAENDKNMKRYFEKYWITNETLFEKNVYGRKGDLRRFRCKTNFKPHK